MHYDDVATAFNDTGLVVRGGFRTNSGEHPPATTIVLIGNTGPHMWPHFAPHAATGDNPLDGWTRRVVAPIADHLQARAVYPSDKPWWPFQQWAQRAEPVTPSPLGILIHPDYGLWHAYRAALMFEDPVAGLAQPADRPSPCDTCTDRPCLASCPVDAFSDAGYDVPACAAHLRTDTGRATCLASGCVARRACPIASDARYPDAQNAFHMTAFLRAR